MFTVTASRYARLLAEEAALNTHPTTDSDALRTFTSAESGALITAGDIVLRSTISADYNTAMISAGFLSADHIYFLEVDVDWGDCGAGAILLGNIPASTTLQTITVEVLTAFTTGVTATVGPIADPDRYMLAGDMTLSTVGTYTKTVATGIGAETPVYMWFDQSKDILAGRATVTMYYRTEMAPAAASHANVGGAAVPVGTIPISKLVKASVNVSQAFPDGVVMNVGTVADPNAYVDESELDLTTVAVTDKTLDIDLAVATDAQAVLTDNGVTTGHDSITLTYEKDSATANPAHDNVGGAAVAVDTLPETSTLVKATINISEAFTSGAAMDIGVDLDHDKYVGQADIDLSAPAIITKTLSTAIPLAEDAKIWMTDNGVLAGQDTVTLIYTMPLTPVVADKDDCGGLPVSLGTLPANSKLIKAVIDVTEAWTAGAMMMIGTEADPDAYVDIPDIDLGHIATLTKTLNFGMALETEVVATCLGESILAGAATITLTYELSLSSVVTSHSNCGGDPVLLGTLPDGCTLTKAVINVTEAYPGRATMDIGKTGTIDAYVAHGDIDLTTVATITKSPLAFAITPATDAYATMGAGTVTVGHAAVTLRYEKSLAAVNTSHTNIGSAVSLGTLPDVSTLTKAVVDITEAYPGRAKIDIGPGADPDLYVDQAEVDLTTVATFTKTGMAFAITPATEAFATMSDDGVTTGHLEITLTHQNSIAKTFVYTEVDGTPTLVGQVPADRVVSSVVIEVTTGFTAGATAKVGTAADPNKYATTTDFDLTSETTQTKTLTSSVSTATNVYVTLSGVDIVAGEAIVTVNYK